MKSIRILILGAVLVVAPRLACAGSETARTITIIANDTLHYNVTHIEASLGEPLHIVLRNGGSVPKEVMGHNWILLRANEPADDYLAAAVAAKADDYEPAALKSKVLAAVPLLGPGQSAEVTFNAPTTPGKYVYLCSFPAHCGAGMRGVLVVH